MSLYSLCLKFFCVCDLNEVGACWSRGFTFIERTSFLIKLIIYELLSVSCVRDSQLPNWLQEEGFRIGWD